MTVSERFWRLRGFLRRPSFQDEEMDRQANLLYAALKPIVIVTMVLIPGLPLVGSPWVVEIPVLFMIAVEAVVWILLGRGQVRQASLVLISVGWVITTIPAFLQGGLVSPFALFTILWVVVAGLLLDQRYLMGMLTLNMITVTILLFTTHYQLIPILIPTATPVRAWLVLLLVLYNGGSLINLSTISLSQALKNARQSQAELARSNTELLSTREDLETRVAQRTADLERRAHALQASSEVVRVIASIRDLDSLLNELAHLLSEQFDTYHVGVLLVDESQRTGPQGGSGGVLVMRASNTEYGRRLQQSGFSLPLDKTSVVSTAVRTRKPYLASDVSQDLLYMALDEFADTRSELALPLISGERVLGALDLQSSVVGAFSPQDLGILQTLANQIAIAIENAQLFNENQHALESLQRAYSSLSQEGWQRMLHAQPDLGYRAGGPGSGYGAGGRSTQASEPWSEEMQQALDTGQVVVENDTDAAGCETAVVPIKIREQVMGVIRLRKQSGAGVWSRDEISLVQTLSDRLSTALESARLYEETRRRAERERLTGEITARMRTSNDPKAILQIAASELRKALQADKTQLIVTTTPAGESVISDHYGDEGISDNRQGGQP